MGFPWSMRLKKWVADFLTADCADGRGGKDEGGGKRQMGDVAGGGGFRLVRRVSGSRLGLYER